MNSITSNLRKLAKSNYFQTIYAGAKELNLKILSNDIDFSQLQIRFLNYLNFYAGLYLDCALGELDDKVFEDFIYEDSYNYWRQKNKNKNPQKEAKSNDINWIFKTKK